MEASQTKYFDFNKKIRTFLRYTICLIGYIIQPFIYLISKVFKLLSKSCLYKTTNDNRQKGSIKPFKEIPGPKGWPIIGDSINFNKMGGPAGFIQYVENLHIQFGDIVKAKLGPKNHIFISNPKHYKEVIRQEGKFPKSFKQPFTTLFKEIHEIRQGLFFCDGEEWYHGKNVLTTLLLKETGFMEHIFETYDKCIADTLRKWANGTTDFEVESHIHFLKGMFHLTFGNEYEKYLKLAGSDLETLAKISIEISELSKDLYKFPPTLSRALGLRIWKRWEELTLENISIGHRCTDFALAAMRSAKYGGSLNEFGLLHRMENVCNASDDEMRSHCTDFTVDIPATSYQIMWTIYALGRNPDVQARIYEEVTSVCPSGELVGFRHLDNMPLVSATQKEIMRMYPIAPFVTRVAPDNMSVGGFNIEKESLVILSTIVSQKNSKYFPVPNKFWPERWFKSNDGSMKGVLNEEAYRPWGIGKRVCSGRTLVIVMLRLLIASVVQNFTVESDEVRNSLKNVLFPDGDMNIRLKKRSENSIDMI